MRKEYRLPVVAAIAVAAALGGLLVGSAVFPGFLNQDAAGKQVQGLLISGTETVKVIAPDGRVVSTWQGPDPLTADSINAIVNCVTGASTTPEGFGSCSGWVNSLMIVFDCSDSDTVGCQALYPTSTRLANYEASTPATSTRTPIGCDATSTSPLCTGWIFEGTFGPATFTSTNCGGYPGGISLTSCGVDGVWSLASSGTFFDCLTDDSQLTAYPIPVTPFCGPTLSWPIVIVSDGDSLLVTIQFTVS